MTTFSRTLALTILAGCPEGATESALKLHGVDRLTLDALVDERLVTVDLQTFAVPRAITVARFRLARAS